jgi:hypothetical protein
MVLVALGVGTRRERRIEQRRASITGVEKTRNCSY